MTNEYIISSIDGTKKVSDIMLNNGNTLRLNILKKGVQFIIIDGSTYGKSLGYTKKQIKKLFLSEDLKLKLTVNAKERIKEFDLNEIISEWNKIFSD